MCVKIPLEVLPRCCPVSSKTTLRRTAQPTQNKQSKMFYVHHSYTDQELDRTDHVEELSEHVKRDVELPRAAPSEKRRNREAGADGGEVIIRVHCTPIREVRA